MSPLTPTPQEGKLIIQFDIDRPHKTVTFYIQDKDITKIAKHCNSSGITPRAISDTLADCITESMKIVRQETGIDVISYTPQVRVIA